MPHRASRRHASSNADAGTDSGPAKVARRHRPISGAAFMSPLARRRLARASTPNSPRNVVAEAPPTQRSARSWTYGRYPHFLLAGRSTSLKLMTEPRLSGFHTIATFASRGSASSSNWNILPAAVRHSMT